MCESKPADMCVLVTHVRIEKALREKRNESESTIVCFLCAEKSMLICGVNVCVCVCVCVGL